MIDFAEHYLSIRQQCNLLGVIRSGLYYHPIIDSDSLTANLIKEIYQQSDCRYGYRKISHTLKNKNMLINHKKVLRLMQEMNIQGLFPKHKINTSKSTLNHGTYPYLLEDMVLEKPNQVWATDITYIHYSAPQ
jgi:putative transposase